MEPHGQSPRSLHEIPAYAWERSNSSVCKDEGFGGLSASSEIRRSINQKHRNQLSTESAFIHWQSPWSSAKADKKCLFLV
jgi:hypothetical protein